MRRLTKFLILASFGSGLAVPSPGLAQNAPPDLSQVSIEDLMNVQITSVSRKEQRADDAAAAVFVITQDDIRRSGMTSLPDVLRLAPGVDVAQINANKWAVSVRGFNSLYSNKLLVLVDGRSVYNRLFSGVLWDVEDLMLDDIDRIEVIRGPGAALWGANAVNGVINIVTKSAADTQGGLVRVDGGRVSEQAAARYGGTFGAASYRVYSQWTRRNESLLAPNTRANDASHSATTGFRVDWNTQPNAFVLEGAFTAGQQRALWFNLAPQTTDPIQNTPSDSRGGHLLSRWTHTRANGASFEALSFVDIASREEPVGDYRRRAFGVDTQYHARLGGRQDLVAGVGYRFQEERFNGKAGTSLTPTESASSLVTAFAQDEFRFFEQRLAVTVGSQVQYDSDSGAGVQPTARVMWTGLPRQRLWAATSRALRTPSLTDRGIQLDYPLVQTAGGLPLAVTVRGNPGALTESLTDAEVGYRLDVARSASVDVTAFVGRYDQLQTQESSAPTFQPVPFPHLLVTSTFGNLLAATTRGVEVSGHWSPLPAWRVDGSYSVFGVTPHLAAASRDPTGRDGRRERARRRSGSSSRRGHRDLARRSARRSSAWARSTSFRSPPIRGPTSPRSGSSAASLSVMAIGQNLFDAAHAEFAGADSLLLSTEVPRSASLRLRWTFR